MLLKELFDESLPGVPRIRTTSLAQLLQVQDYPGGRVTVDKRDRAHVLPPPAPTAL